MDNADNFGVIIDPISECEQLRKEVARLSHLLRENGIDPFPTPSKPTNSASAPTEKTTKFSTEQKIEVFRSLFRGREDVFAVRWEGPNGRYGYSPASKRDWSAYNAAKPEGRKRVDKETRTYLPLTNQAIHDHLAGKQTIGVYPLLPDETCWFLAADFDKDTWQEDATAFLESCSSLGVPAALERSRSGKGGHVWVFFDKPVPAVLARKLGTFLLTRTMERRHQLGLNSYDRFFPNQDTMPKGGLGNLIALPLQKIPGLEHHTEFLTENLQPYADQWAYLLSLRRMTRLEAEKLILVAQQQGDLIGIQISVVDEDEGQDPWTLPPSRHKIEKPIDAPLPATVSVVRSNLIYVEKAGLPPALLNRILRLAAFQNPEFYKAQAMRLSIFDKPRVIGCGDDLSRHLALPRGCLADLSSLLVGLNIKPAVRDERTSGQKINVAFHGTLRLEQEQAATAIAKHDDGLLCAPTAFGKTAVSAWLVAHRGVNTLVLVHRQQLLDQWRERLAMFLNLRVEEIGQIGAGKTIRTGMIDVAVIQSLYRDKEVKDFVTDYGHIIVDECHHLSAFTFEKVMRAAKAKFVIGLTATPTRKDGHHPIMYMQCGPARFSMSARAMTESSPFEHMVIPRTTHFQMLGGASDITIQDVYAAISTDTVRNESIARDVVEAVRRGRSPLLLTGRTEHLSYFEKQLSGLLSNVFVLKGGMGRKQRKATSNLLAQVPDGEQRVILATGSYIGEGFDDARLDTLFLAMPISWKGTLQQYVGRLHRLHDNKRVVEVYDYVDPNVRMLARMYERRLRGYADMGYKISKSVAVGAG